MSEKKRQTAMLRPARRTVKPLPPRTSEQKAHAAAFIEEQTAVMRLHKARFEADMKAGKPPCGEGEWFCYYHDPVTKQDRVTVGKTQIEAFSGVIGSCYLSQMVNGKATEDVSTTGYALTLG
jgi:hypothetical protein